jgi:hypothetical protein
MISVSVRKTSEGIEEIELSLRSLFVQEPTGIAAIYSDLCNRSRDAFNPNAFQSEGHGGIPNGIR